MRLPRVRFTVWRLMVGVALISVAMGVTREVRRLGRLSRQYQRKAREVIREGRLWRTGLAGSVTNEAEARHLSIVLRTKDQDLADLWGIEVSVCSLQVRELREILTHYEKLRQKYVRAASRPWEAVPPDPREPTQSLIWHCVPLPKEPLPTGERWYAEEAESLRAAGQREKVIERINAISKANKK